jgi:hypothetical protein
VLLAAEDLPQHERLSAQVTAAVEPCDVIEVFCVRDVVDLLWEVLRLRRLKASLLLASAASGLARCRVGARRDPLQTVARRRKIGPCAGRQVSQRAWSLTVDAITAQTLSKKLDDVERIDRMIANAEARRHVVLREIAAVAARWARQQRRSRRPS